MGVTGDTFFATHTGVSKAALRRRNARAHTGLDRQTRRPVPIPDVGPNPYKVYAGDCAANSPKTVARHRRHPRAGRTERHGQAKSRSARVQPDGLQGGDDRAKACWTTRRRRRTDHQHGDGARRPSHPVKINSAGLLEQKYQPYAKELQVCVVGLISGHVLQEHPERLNEHRQGRHEPVLLPRKKRLHRVKHERLTC